MICFIVRPSAAVIVRRCALARTPPARAAALRAVKNAVRDRCNAWRRHRGAPKALAPRAELVAFGVRARRAAGGRKRETEEP
jgi:hypothetical protein